MSQATPGSVTFSFIAPVHNEEAGLERFHSRLTAVAKKLGEPYEIILVNDGSIDASDAVIRRLAIVDPHVKYVEFSRNFGHQAAITAGYDHASGRAVISLDSDCQHPPELIPELVAQWREGFEIVYTVRRDTRGISLVRRATSRLAYRMIRFVSGIDLTNQADFRLMDRRAVEALKANREHARFVRGLVRWIGFRQTGIPYTAEARTTGRSTYTLRQQLNMTTAGMFNFSVRPLRLIAGLGGVLMGLAMFYLVLCLALLWPLAAVPSGLWHLAMAVVGLTGLQMTALGLVGEYVGRIFEEAKGRPLYVVRQVGGFEPATPPPQAQAEEARVGEPAEQDEERDNWAVYT